MSFSEIILLMGIALVLFGPEDLPEIARTLGKVVYEIRKATADLTGGFSDIMQSPADTLSRAFDASSRNGEGEGSEGEEGSPEGNSEGTAKTEDEELLDYEGNPAHAETGTKVKGQDAGEFRDKKDTDMEQREDPLAELPPGVVSYEKKDASR